MAARHWSEIKLDEVAERAGVGKGTLYLYFRDKKDLFFQVVFSGFDALCSGIAGHSCEDTTFAVYLRETCAEISTFFANRRAVFQSMQNEEARIFECGGRLQEAWLQHRRRLVDAVGGVLELGQQQGVLRDDVPPPVLANFLLGMLRTRARDLADADPSYRSHDFILEMFLHGAGSGQRRKRDQAFSNQAIS